MIKIGVDVFLCFAGYVYHLKYQKRIEDYIVKYMDLLDIRIGDVNPKRLKKMYNKVVNNLGLYFFV